MSNTTISEIRHEIAALIAGISQARGFHFDWGTVNERFNVKYPSALIPCPSCEVKQVSGKYEEVTLKFRICVESLAIARGNHHDQDNFDALDASVEDIRRAFIMQGRLASNGERVQVKKWDFVDGEDGDLFTTGVIEIECETTYNTLMLPSEETFPALSVVASYETEPDGTTVVTGEVLVS